MACIDLRSQRLVHWDSMGGGDPRYRRGLLSFLARWVQDRAHHELTAPLPHTPHPDLLRSYTQAVHWQQVYTGTHVPQQTGVSNDCGIFACVYAVHHSVDLPFDFNSDMHMVRRRFNADLLRCRID